MIWWRVSFWMLLIAWVALDVAAGAAFLHQAGGTDRWWLPVTVLTGCLTGVPAVVANRRLFRGGAPEKSRGRRGSHVGSSPRSGYLSAGLALSAILTVATPNGSKARVIPLLGVFAATWVIVMVLGLHSAAASVDEQRSD